MMTWRYAPLQEACGSCDGLIAIGEIELFIDNASGRRVRCKDCGGRMTNEPPPESLPDDPDAEHEPTSLMALAQAPRSTGFVSVEELARRRTANHFKQRGRR